MRIQELKDHLLPHLQNAMQIDDPWQPIRWMGGSDAEELDRSDPLFAALGHELLEIDELRQFQWGNNLYLPDLVCGTTMWELTQWLVERAVICGSAEVALDDLFAFVEKPEMVVHHIQPLAEVVPANVELPYRFPNDVYLRDAGSIPNASLAFHLTRPARPIPSSHYYCALTKEHRYTVPPGAKGRVDCGVNIEDSGQALEDVCLCLSLAAPIAKGVFGSARTFAPDYRVPFGAGFGQWQMHPFAQPSASFSLQSAALDEGRRLAELLDGLRPAAARRIRVPLRHLNMFGARLSHVERAIHLRIALETTFLEEGNSGEMRYRLSLHAALVSGPGVTERQEVKALVRKAYDLSSKAVHQGTLPYEDFEKLTAAAEVCRNALRLFLENGGLPKDWSEIETEGFQTTRA